MGILQGIFHSRDKPQNRTVGSNFTFFMGGSTSGKPVNERTAMQTKPCMCQNIQLVSVLENFDDSPESIILQRWMEKHS